jgi:hypothetical protein
MCKGLSLSLNDDAGILFATTNLILLILWPLSHHLGEGHIIWCGDELQAQ